MHDIFLSYSRKDTEMMQRVKQSFISAGLKVWTDEGIEAGTEDWQRAIEEAIKDTKALICICSPEAKDSRWVKAELKRAELRKKLIFLVLADGDELDSIPFGYEHHQFSDIRQPENYTRQIDALISTIKQKLGQSNSPIHQAEIKLDKAKSILPEPFDWCEIPAGKVRLITREDWSDNYVPKGDTGLIFEVPAFAIAKYPITNAQFAPFVEAGGYKNKAWWTDAGWAQKDKEKWTEPHYWQNNDFNGAEQPVVGVSWYEALAFCLWLSEASSEKIMLPTEQQWQRAAQGDDGRAYPWGNSWDANRCNNNVDRKGMGKSNHVTQYQSLGASSFGVVDMTGNVWEWVLTEYDRGGQDVNGTNARSLRGASWKSGHADNFRVDCRFRYNPNYAKNDWGFRIVRLP